MERRLRAGEKSRPLPIPSRTPVSGGVPSPGLGQAHPGIVAGGVGTFGAAGFGQGDDFADEVGDLLKGGVGVFPAVGNDGPGSREQGEGELAGMFLLKK